MYITEGMKHNMHKFEELLLDELDEAMEEAIEADGEATDEMFEGTKLLLKNLFYLHWLKCEAKHKAAHMAEEE